jgi:Zn finger protein HypA/HybF involved in hydrogenase expression
MHEFSIIEGFVGKLAAQLQNEHVSHVDQIHFRRNSTFSEDALRMAFAACSAGTPLERTEVVIETVRVEFSCQCGYHQFISADDLQGHMVICPECGAVREIDEAHDLTMTMLVIDGKPAVFS